jgi:hypothetical protein
MKGRYSGVRWDGVGCTYSVHDPEQDIWPGSEAALYQSVDSDGTDRTKRQLALRRRAKG